ncbi:LemA family protein [Chitinibacter bivalviorum]|uniref:LemA family protein n=2 Tax=Chitinibacter bivalviorum TaxID=2739434 RepID=A0A7H9BQY9_9NEIS|nr:LemA family protein [Chitinibacter bivalviorum]
MKRLILIAVLSATLSGCGYNALQAQDENVNAAWSEVLNQYQRRADLVPNLVNVVKGYAAHEEKVLIEVTQARAKVGSMQITPELAKDEAALAKFQEAQAGMTSALSRLMVVAEKYPDLKANQNFRDLSAQLEGTENRIAVARNRYIETVKTFNTTARSFPTNLTAKMFDLNPKPNFKVENEKAISTAPTVDFNSEKK